MWTKDEIEWTPKKVVEIHDEVQQEFNSGKIKAWVPDPNHHIRESRRCRPPGGLKPFPNIFNP
jgi:hypothetical protein